MIPWWAGAIFAAAGLVLLIVAWARSAEAGPRNPFYLGLACYIAAVALGWLAFGDGVRPWLVTRDAAILLLRVASLAVMVRIVLRGPERPLRVGAAGFGLYLLAYFPTEASQVLLACGNRCPLSWTQRLEWQVDVRLALLVLATGSLIAAAALGRKAGGIGALFAGLAVYVAIPIWQAVQVSGLQHGFSHGVIAQPGAWRLILPLVAASVFLLAMRRRTLSTLGLALGLALLTVPLLWNGAAQAARCGLRTPGIACYYNVTEPTSPASRRLTGYVPSPNVLCCHGEVFLLTQGESQGLGWTLFARPDPQGQCLILEYFAGTQKGSQVSCGPYAQRSVLAEHVSVWITAPVRGPSKVDFIVGATSPATDHVVLMFRNGQKENIQVVRSQRFTNVFFISSISFFSGPVAVLAVDHAGRIIGRDLLTYVVVTPSSALPLPTATITPSAP